MHQVAADARQLAADAPHLADQVAAARAGVDRFADGLDQLAAGASRLHQGTTDAHRGAVALSGGLYRLSTGARQLDTGLSTVDGGVHRLAGGLADLQSGADQLAGGLSDGAGKIPGYDRDGVAARAGVLADPVALRRQVQHPAGTYGVGFAPYFEEVGHVVGPSAAIVDDPAAVDRVVRAAHVALGLDNLVTHTELRITVDGPRVIEINGRSVTMRHVLSGAPARRVAWAGWLPAATIGAVQAGLLYAVLRLGLGLRPVHPLATLAFLLLAAFTFTAIVQWLGARLGPAGRLAALALLMLQLTSSGGTYPVQTTPGFFQAIHPWLPMSYVVDGLRHLVDGGSTGTVITGSAVLAGFAAAAFALTTLAARRARRMSPPVLHPELVL